MKKRPIISILDSSVRNKNILERAGLSARAYYISFYASPLSPPKGGAEHILTIFADTLQTATFFQDFRNLNPKKNIYILNQLPLNSQNENIRALLIERGETLRHWIKTGGVLVTTPGALMTSCLLGTSEIKIKINEKFEPEKIRTWLEFSGYKHSNLVWAPGQYVQRGFILDVFDASYSMPLRFEFFDDEIERIGSFHPDTQKSSSELMALDEIILHGMNDAVKKFPTELIPKDTLVIINEPEKTEADAESFSWLVREIQNGDDLNSWEKVFNEISTFPLIRLILNTEKSDAELPTEALPAFKDGQDSILNICDELEKNDFKIHVFTDNPVFRKLRYEIHAGTLSTGFIDRANKKVFVSDRELSGINANVSLNQWRTPHEWLDAGKLSIGQLVVHEDYGTGIFRGIETIDASGIPMNVLVIEFAGDQRLLIPVLQSHKITALNEHENELSKTKIDSLKGRTWKKNAQKTQEQAEKEAEILMEIFARRQLERRTPFAEPDNIYNDFINAFPFNETSDQLKAIAEIMKDFSSNFPMDRLLVGDVGFGKTEVALRAAFRVIMSGYQVCVLVPTTILAQQHYTTFQSRLSGFPVKVGLLSRFITPKQAKEVLNLTAEGKIDILIGTHKLLQKGVSFKNLGFLIIDEEHRFGVMHKESLKKTYGSVDILSLSATPIPRTLAMSLRGLRSISVLSTPPEDRLPVSTFTGKWNPGTVRRAIAYELNRGGQVYFLSNRISRMSEYETMLNAFFPEANIRKAHGQMPEKELEKTMLDFYAGKIDILIATTIIESGLDVGRANTIIIDNSEELGLAQMYQLRGRVGRRGEKAFAYFFYPEKSALNQDTFDRLEAISTMTDLGSGYAIARRDLEIRGGGEIGGTHQHGNANSASFNLFYRMLEHALNKLRGIEERKLTEINSDMGNGFIPEFYIPQDDVRITVYRRMLNAVGLDEFDMLVSEMRDRFGKIPPEVKYLAGLIAVKNFGAFYGVERVDVKGGLVRVTHHNSELPEKIKKYLKSLGRNIKYIQSGCNI